VTWSFASFVKNSRTPFSAASLQALSISAPENPSVSCARTSESVSPSTSVFARNKSKSEALVTLFGSGTVVMY
jgi:hypothetical protein